MSCYVIVYKINNCGKHNTAHNELCIDLLDIAFIVDLIQTVDVIKLYEIAA